MAGVDKVAKAMAETHDIVMQAIIKVYSGETETQLFALFIIDEYEYALRRKLEQNDDNGSTKKSDA